MGRSCPKWFQGYTILK